MDSGFLVIRKDWLKCPVCYDSAVDSFSVFPCGHSVCSSCTTMIMARMKCTWMGEKYYECPTCRHQVFHAENQSPPRNFVVQYFLDSAISLPNEFSLRMLKLREDLCAAEKKSALRTDQIAAQQQIIEELRDSNVKLKKQMKVLNWVDILGFLLTLLLLAGAVQVAFKVCQGRTNKAPSCPKVEASDSDYAREKVKRYIEAVRLLADGKPFITGDQVRSLFASRHGVAERTIAEMPPYMGPDRMPDTYDYVFYSIDQMPYGEEVALFQKPRAKQRSEDEV